MQSFRSATFLYSELNSLPDADKARETKAVNIFFFFFFFYFEFIIEMFVMRRLFSYFALLEYFCLFLKFSERRAAIDNVAKKGGMAVLAPFIDIDHDTRNQAFVCQVNLVTMPSNNIFQSRRVYRSAVANPESTKAVTLPNVPRFV